MNLVLQACVNLKLPVFSELFIISHDIFRLGRSITDVFRGSVGVGIHYKKEHPSCWPPKAPPTAASHLWAFSLDDRSKHPSESHGFHRFSPVRAPGFPVKDWSEGRRDSATRLASAPLKAMERSIEPWRPRGRAWGPGREWRPKAFEKSQENWSVSWYVAIIC